VLEMIGVKVDGGGCHCRLVINVNSREVGFLVIERSKKLTFSLG